jgi:hypothetical protein
MHHTTSCHHAGCDTPAPAVLACALRCCAGPVSFLAPPGR